MGLSDLTTEYVPILVTNWPTGFPLHDLRVLIGDADSLLPGPRVPLYVCAECGDIGCGAVTASMILGEDSVTWHRFGYQTGDDSADDVGEFQDVGPLTFDRHAYESVLADLYTDWLAADRP